MDLEQKVEENRLSLPVLSKWTTIGGKDKKLLWSIRIDLFDKKGEPVDILVSNLLQENYRTSNYTMINITHGYENGKMRTDPPRMVTKENVAYIGTRREKNVLTQAIGEAESRYRSQVEKKGYELNREGDDDEEREFKFSPMLLHQYESKYFVDDGVVQPKYDGVRSYVRFSDGEVIMHSRTHQVQRNNEKFTDPLTNLFTAMKYPEDVILDGEVFVWGLSFEKVAGVLNAKKKLTGVQLDIQKRMKYVVFDGYIISNPDAVLSERCRLLKKAFETLDDDDKKIIRLAPTIPVDTEKDLMKIFDAFVEYGFEGAVYKQNVPYTMRRTTTALKLKQVKEEEYTIKGFSTGKGSNEGAMIWILELPNGKTFRQSHISDMKEKKRLYRQAQKEGEEVFVGKKLTLRFRDRGPNKIPKHVLLTAFREDL